MEKIICGDGICITTTTDMKKNKLESVFVKDSHGKILLKIERKSDNEVIVDIEDEVRIDLT